MQTPISSSTLIGANFVADLMPSTWRVTYAQNDGIANLTVEAGGSIGVFAGNILLALAKFSAYDELIRRPEFRR